MAKIDRPTIIAGNDTTLYIQLKEFVEGEYVDVDLTHVSNLKVELLCAKDNYKYEIPYRIDETYKNLIICDLKYTYYHSNTSYGIIVTGTNLDEKHWTWCMMPREGFNVVSNTSGLHLTDEAQQLSFNGLVGWGIQTDGDLTNYYTKIEVNNLLDEKADESELSSKQDELVSGQNIKTINNQSLLGSGNIVIEGTEQLQSDWTQTDTSAKDYIKHKPTIPAAQVNSDWNATSGVAKILNKPDLSIYATEQELDNYYDKGETDGLLNNKVDVSTLNNDYYNKNTVDNLLDAKVDTSDLAPVATSGSYNDLSNKPDLTQYATHTELNTKQDTLVSGTNIKTINNQSLLGSGNVDIQSGGFVPLVNGNKTGLVNSLSVDYDTNIGNKAIIEGCGNGSSVTRASGDYSHTEGLETIASGESAHAEGYHTRSIGAHSHSEGHWAQAVGDNAHAEGYQTQATAGMAHAEGDNTKAYGTHSHAEGSGTYATGNNAHAEGSGNADPRSLPNNTTDISNNGLEARGEHSHAEGWATKAFGPKSHAEGERSIATGQMAHAEGLETIASGVCSHSEGDNTRATGTHAHAEGWQTQATGENSHAEGNATQARSLGSHAEGDHTTAGQQNCNNCHAEGYSTTAIGDNSHAEGINTLADGDYSHAEGNTTRTDGEDAHAEGSSTVAVGDHSHTEGYGTRANNESEHASGYCNVSTASSNGNFDPTNSTATLFSVGNGADPNHRHNAFEIKMNGDIYLNDGTKLQDKLDDSDEVTANALYELNSRLSETELNVNLIPDEIDSKITPLNEKIDDISNDVTDLTNDIDNTNLANSLILTELHNEITTSTGFVPVINKTSSSKIGLVSSLTLNEGQSQLGPLWDTIGRGAVIEGDNECTADGNHAHVEGSWNYANGNCSHAEGSVNAAYGNSAHVEGCDNIAQEVYTHAEGFWTRALGQISHSEGLYSQAEGKASHTEGAYTETNNYAEHAGGTYNISTAGVDPDIFDPTDNLATLFSVGNGSDNNNRHNAFEIKQNGDIYLNDGTCLQTDINNKQDELVSGTNIKTVNGNSLLGSGDITVGGSSDPIYYIDIDWQLWPQDPTWQGNQAIYFKSVTVYDLTTGTQVYYGVPGSSKSLSAIFNEIYSQLSIRSNIYIDSLQSDISNYTFRVFNYRYYLMDIPQTFANKQYGNGSVILIRFCEWDSTAFKVKNYCNNIVIPLGPGQHRMVTSTTSGLKVETVSSAPSGTVPVTLAFDSTTNTLYIVQ